MSILLNGRELALNLRKELKEKIIKANITPRLGVILVGDEPASHLYVSLKERAAEEVGVVVEKILLPSSALTQEVISWVQKFNQRPEINGILIQLPLPNNIDQHTVISAMSPQKDADGFHPQNLDAFIARKESIVPGVSSGIMKLIDLAKQPLNKKIASLVVNSQEFAIPLRKLLTDKGVEVNVIHKPISEQLKKSDIIITALGQPKIIKGYMIKDGAIVVDVGTTKINNKVLGDVEAEALLDRHVYLTPVPGGVGPMTVAMLLWNVYELARRQV